MAINEQDYIRVRCRINKSDWPYTPPDSNTQKQLIQAFDELRELRELRDTLQAIDDNPAVALGRLLQAYESSNQPVSSVLSSSVIDSRDAGYSLMPQPDIKEATEGQVEAIENTSETEEFFDPDEF